MMSKTFLLIFVLCTLCCVVVAQPISGGVKIGAPLTDAFQIAGSPATISTFAAHADSFLWGPFLEVKLPFKFSVEVDALHRGYSFAGIGPSTGTSSWQFPIVAKYHFLKGPVKPYAEGGVSFSHLTDVPQVLSLNHASNFGVVVGAGVQINLLVLRIAPEVRYTGDTVKNFNGLLDSNRNQVAFLVGIGFGGR